MLYEMSLCQYDFFLEEEKQMCTLEEKFWFYKFSDKINTFKME